MAESEHSNAEFTVPRPGEAKAEDVLRLLSVHNMVSAEQRETALLALVQLLRSGEIRDLDAVSLSTDARWVSARNRTLHRMVCFKAQASTMDWRIFSPHCGVARPPFHC